MRDGMRRRRLVRCCADGVWWRGERCISVMQRAAPPCQAWWAPMLQRSRDVADRPRHEPSNSPNVLIARIAAALGLALCNCVRPFCLASVLQALAGSSAATDTSALKPSGAHWLLRLCVVDDTFIVEQVSIASCLPFVFFSHCLSSLCGSPGDGSGQGSECSRRWPRCVERFEAVVESLALRRGVS